MATKTKLLPRARMLKGYDPEKFFDEMLDADGDTRPHYRQFRDLFQTLTTAEFEHKRQSMDLAFLRQGITFNVYGDSAGAEKIFPFDLLPRIIPAKEWEMLERGLAQRITALNLFLHDIYHEQKILQGRRHPAVLRSVRETFPARVRELQRAEGHLHSRLRHGFDPRRQTAITWCWRTTGAVPAASVTCWKTAAR